MLVRVTNLPRGYTNIANALIRARDLPIGPKMLLILLASFDWGPGGCRVGQRRIAAELDIDVRTVRRHLKYLMDRGIVSILPGATRSRSKYVLNLSAFDADKNAPPRNAESVKYDRPIEGADTSVDGAKMSPNVTTADKKTPTTTDDAARLQHTEICKLLAAVGINEPTQSEIADSCSLEHVRAQIEWTNLRNVRDPAAALVAALRAGWREPHAARVSRERAEENAMAGARARNASALVNSVTVAEGAREASRLMPATKRYEFWDRASEALGGKAAIELYGRSRYDEMQAKYALYLIGESMSERVS